MSESALSIRAGMLKEAMIEAERFLKVAREAMGAILREECKPAGDRKSQLIELASAKRASLDLTRKLAAFRN